MNVALRSATLSASFGRSGNELQLPVMRGWGFASFAVDGGKEGDDSPETGIVVAEALCAKGEVGLGSASCGLEPVADPSPVWIGAEPESVLIDGVSYRLSLVFVGRPVGEGGSEYASVALDPTLTVRDAPVVTECRDGIMTSYQEFDPGTRRAYLEWIDGGRLDAGVPLAFLLHFVHTLEIMLIVHERLDVAAAARAATEAQLLLHPDVSEFHHCAKALIELCDWVDPVHVSAPIFASAEGNHAKEMPFAVRRYLGEALGSSNCLEADAALLFLLKQPRAKLKTYVAQHFGVLYHHWTENYSYRFNGGVKLDAKESLSLRYECLDGTPVELKSDVPDPASAAVPPELWLFYQECSDELEQLRGLPVAQQTALTKRIVSKPQLRGVKPEWSLRPDFEARFVGRFQSPGPALLQASDVLGDLFENTKFIAKKQVPVPVFRRMQAVLSDVGIGFEPDVRFGLPARIRPDTQIALFSEEQWPFEEPSEAFHLAQAALTLSAIGMSQFSGLAPLRLADIEPLLAFRHRFSERETRRLQATFLFIQSAVQPRVLLDIWFREMKRNRRAREIDLGFGIAFHEQATNPLVKRFATAVSKALNTDDRHVSGLLQQVNAHAKARADIIENNGCRSIIDERPGASCARVLYDRASTGLPRGAVPKSSVEGLPVGVAAILEALLVRPRARTELNEISVRCHLQVSGALQQLNEWSLVRFRAKATRGHSTVRINPEVFEALELLVHKP